MNFGLVTLFRSQSELSARFGVDVNDATGVTRIVTISSDKILMIDVGILLTGRRQSKARLIRICHRS